MLRLIHNQTIAGSIFVDDIDDGLPNKNVHRLGSTADPKAYPRDGYANKAKQPSYVPVTKKYPVVVNGPPAWYSTVPGYIDVEQTPRVILSAAKGKIFKLSQPGPTNYPLITVVSFTAADVAAPVVTGATIGLIPADLTIVGTGFLSLTPNDSTVYITGTGAVAPLTRLAILALGGTAQFTDLLIVIPAAAVPLIASPGTFVRVNSDDHISNVFTV